MTVSSVLFTQSLDGVVSSDGLNEVFKLWCETLSYHKKPNLLSRRLGTWKRKQSLFLFIVLFLPHWRILNAHPLGHSTEAKKSLMHPKQSENLTHFKQRTASSFFTTSAYLVCFFIGVFCALTKEQKSVSMHLMWLNSAGNRISLECHLNHLVFFWMKDVLCLKSFFQ